MLSNYYNEVLLKNIISVPAVGPYSSFALISKNGMVLHKHYLAPSSHLVSSLRVNALHCETIALRYRIHRTFSRLAPQILISEFSDEGPS